MKPIAKHGREKNGAGERIAWLPARPTWIT